MRRFDGRGSGLAALALALLLPLGADHARASIADDAPSAVSLPSGTLPAETAGIRKVLEAYIRAVHRPLAAGYFPGQSPPT